MSAPAVNEYLNGRKQHVNIHIKHLHVLYVEQATEEREGGGYKLLLPFCDGKNTAVAWEYFDGRISLFQLHLCIVILCATMYSLMN